MHYRKPKLQLFIFCLMLTSKILFAHNPDLSNIIISKTDSGQIILQINSSLTAFQQEVIYLNGEGAYQSPEDFQNLVLNHFNATFSIIVNERDTLQFKNPKVFLGHETKLVAEIIGLPETVTTIHLKNELFKDVHNNQSVVIFLLDDFPKEKYTLNKTNTHQIAIELKDGKWNELEIENTDSYFKYLEYAAIPAIVLLLFYVVRKRKNISA